ncbi:MAG: type II secretion system protein [Phycisphaeraceae bacterium]
MTPRPTQHGFTIVELIVTLSILGLMLFLINELFQDTSVAVTTSVQTSKVIATTRVVNEQIDNDAAAMIGPSASVNEGGFLVIYQRRLPAGTIRDPQTLTEAPNAVPLRIDQMVFIRDAQGLSAMTPLNNASYGTTLVGLANDKAKVWYGHVQRTEPDGTRSAAANTALGEADAGLDRIANDFILGRQALLFDPTNTATNNALSVNATNITHATSAYYNAPVVNSGFVTPSNVFMGLTDVTNQDYSGFYALLTDNVPINDEVDYLNTLYRFNNDRLRVNTSPDPDATNFAAGAIAQGHPILAPGCSEFIIDFAADLNGDGQIDTAFGGQSATTDAPIFWYDALDPVQNTIGGATNWVGGLGIPRPFVNLNANAKAFIFRVNDHFSFEDQGGVVGTPNTAHSYWPYLIRIRYRLHDTRGRLTSNHPLALRDGIDNDGDGAIDENNEDQISGRWFERIIRVPRP